MKRALNRSVVFCVAAMAGGCASAPAASRVVPEAAVESHGAPPPLLAEREHPAAVPLIDAVRQTSASAEDERVIGELEKALALYQRFIETAGNDEHYAQAVQRSRERMVDIRETIDFMRRGMLERER